MSGPGQHRSPGQPGDPAPDTRVMGTEPEDQALEAPPIRSREPMRRSTAVLLVAFVAALVLYLMVHPDSEDVTVNRQEWEQVKQNSSRFTSTASPETPATPSGGTSPSPSRTTDSVPSSSGTASQDPVPTEPTQATSQPSAPQTSPTTPSDPSSTPTSRPTQSPTVETTPPAESTEPDARVSTTAPATDPPR